LYLTNAWFPVGHQLCGNHFTLNDLYLIMAQALVASNKNGCVQINFGTLFCREIREYAGLWRS